MDKITEITNHRIIPVIVVEDASHAEDLGRTLIEAGLPVAEVTLRTPAALESIRIMKEKFPELLLGAGTVLTVEDLHAARDAGATFAVSPCLEPEVVKEALKLDLPIFPGITNPTQAWQAMKLGLTAVKFFPAGAAGGLGMIKSMAAVFPDLKIMPTGGVNAKNAGEYLAHPSVPAVGGSWIVQKSLINEGRWDEIKSLITEALKQGE